MNKLWSPHPNSQFTGKMTYRVGLWKIVVITLIKENSTSMHSKDFQKNVYTTYLPTTYIYVYKICIHLLTKNLLFDQKSNLTGSLSKVSLKINSKNQKIKKKSKGAIILPSLSWLVDISEFFLDISPNGSGFLRLSRKSSALLFSNWEEFCRAPKDRNKKK